MQGKCRKSKFNIQSNKHNYLHLLLSFNKKSNEEETD